MPQLTNCLNENFWVTCLHLHNSSSPLIEVDITYIWQKQWTTLLTDWSFKKIEAEQDNEITKKSSVFCNVKKKKKKKKKLKAEKQKLRNLGKFWRRHCAKHKRDKDVYCKPTKITRYLETPPKLLQIHCTLKARQISISDYSSNTS